MFIPCTRVCTHVCTCSYTIVCPWVVCPTLLLFPVGLNIKEVAHDYQPTIRKYLEEEVKCLNSFDTWHGTCSA